MSQNRKKVKTNGNGVTLRALKAACRREGLTITELAELVGCSRPAIYFAMEKPTRYPGVVRRIKENIDL